MATTTIPAFITSAVLQTEMSAAGISLRVDDDAARTAAAILDASIEAYGYVGLQYTIPALQGSAWFAQKVKWIAVFMLATTRLNACPQGAVVKYEKAIKDLEAVRDGQTQIVDAAQRKEAIPVMSKPRVSLRPWPRIVVQPSLSTGTPEGYAPANDPFDYDI